LFFISLICFNPVFLFQRTDLFWSLLFPLKKIAAKVVNYFYVETKKIKIYCMKQKKYQN